MILASAPRVLAPATPQRRWISLRTRAQSRSVSPPPGDFSYRRVILANTYEIVRSRWPQLLDIVRDGSLIAVRNPNAGRNGEPELVILMGTAHVSKVSAEQVERAIKAIRPDNVVVELCKSRVGVMYSDANTTDRKPSLFDLLGGGSALLLRLLLAGVAKKISKSAPVPIGEEFRAARRAAKEVKAQLVLGDRPIEITLDRAWRALTWKERLRLGSILLQILLLANVDASEAALQSMKSDGMISSMYYTMSALFPSLLRYLVWERDLYMAWSLRRSKAVSGSKIVVGVVGKGHLSGLVHALLYNEEHLSFRDLVGSGKVKDSLSSIYKGIIAEGALGLLLWLIYSYISTDLAA